MLADVDVDTATDMDVEVDDDVAITTHRGPFIDGSV
jgi:hypothetical protein